jgi:uncharacterized protein (DUF1499 family)
MANKVTVTVKLTKSVQAIVEVNTIEKDADFEKFLSKFEADLIKSTKMFNSLIDEVEASMPMTMIITMVQTYLIAEQNPEIIIILKAYSLAAEKDDKVVSLELSSSHGKRIVKIPVHQVFKPMYN